MRTRLLTLALSLAVAVPAQSQGFMAEMHYDVNQVQKKFIDLANAIPESAFAYRPGAGVRSTGEVLLHVASDNYLIPIAMGKAAPASSGITSDYNTAITFEKKTMTKAQVIAELEASFKHLHQAMALTTDANAREMIKFFGQDWSRERAMVLTVTHLHEHLGQLIAYARTSGVKPPWS